MTEDKSVRRRPCGTCGNEYTVVANGTIRHHFTEDPELQAGPDSRKCKGAGQPPAGPAGVALAEDMETGQPQCRLCKHPVQLTGNGRSRSHLTTEQTPRQCPGGSDFPLGTYPDMVGTTDGLVATLARDCGHVPAGECYGCYAARGAENCPDHDDPIECTCQAKAGQAQMAAEKQTMAEQLKAVQTDDFGQPIRECFNCDVVSCTGCGEPAPVDGRPEASRFTELLRQETRGAGTVLDRIDPAVFRDHRTPEQKTADAEMSRLTREAIKVLEQRSPEQKAETAALGLPLDPALNHRYTDPSGTVWVHEGPEETCQAPDCVTMRQGLPAGFDPKCGQCNTDNHRCPGCGDSVPHGTVACTPCDRRVMANRLPKGETEDGRPCHHDDATFGVEDDRLVCVACGTPCTHPDGFKGTADDVDEDGQDRVVSTCELCGAMDPEDELPDDDEAQHLRTTLDALDRQQVEADAWRTPADMLELMPPDVRDLDALRLNCGTCGHPVTPLVEAFDLYGKAKAVLWVCEPAQHAGTLSCDKGGHECKPDTRARLGDLDEGDCFVRNDTLMRLTERESATSVLAEVLDGPHKGRTGELKNPDEVVERAPEPGDRHAREADTAIATVEAERAEEDRQYNAVVSQALADNRANQETGPVLVGELEVGEHFIRRGTVMRVTAMPVGGSVRAVVVEGPMAGREGELSNWGETVERTHCRHNYTYADDGRHQGHDGVLCDYCEAPDPATEPTTEQETKECTDATRPQQRPGSSAGSTQTTTSPTTAPAPGSRRPTKASAPAVSPKSGSVTSSAPTATAAGNGRSAAVTTDQASAAARFLGGGRPAGTGGTGAPNQADAAAQFLAGGSGAHGEKETDRDHWGRYLILHPDTGKEKAWTRATTFAKSISDTYALSQWSLRMALLGATVRPDIVQRAHGKHVKVDKKLLDELTADLKNAAGDKVAANLGTSMHSFTELADRAWHSPGGPRSVMGQVPPEAREMVETYIRLLEETGLEPVSDLIEFTTLVKQYGVAGTSDNCYRVTKPLLLKIGRAEVRLNPGEYVIGDKKTGKDLDYGWQEIAIQLAVYAQGLSTVGRWDRREKKWYPKPLGDAKVRLDAGVVLHLPVDKESEKTPTVYGVDLESGWNAAVLCERVREWRKFRNLSGPVMVSEADTFAPARPEPQVTTRTTIRPPSLRDKANAVTSKGEASAVWKEAKEAGLPDAEVDELVAVMQARLKNLAEPAG